MLFSLAKKDASKKSEKYRTTFPPTTNKKTRAIPLLKNKQTEPTRRISGITCERVQCDPISSSGCYYEKNRIAKCKCKGGYQNHGRFRCIGM